MMRRLTEECLNTFYRHYVRVKDILNPDTMQNCDLQTPPDPFHQSVYNAERSRSNYSKKKKKLNKKKDPSVS